MFIFQIKVTSELIKNHTGLVVGIAKGYQGRGVTLEELVQTGKIGLFIAAKKYNPAKGASFGTYATYWIKNELLREIQKAREIKIPEYKLSQIRKLSMWHDDLEQKLNRKPTNKELALVSKINEDVIDRLRVILVPSVSLDAPLLEGSKQSALVKDKTSVSQDAIDIMLVSELQTKLLNLIEISKLKVVEIKVLKWRHGLLEGPESKTLQEIAEMLNLSRERVRQIESKALRKLRSAIGRDKQLRSYFF